MDIIVLKNAGVNYEEGLQRFAGKAQLYEKYIGKYLDDPTFQQLETSLENADYDTAFRLAHTMKGTVGNLSFDNFYQMIVPLVEVLRNKEYDKINDYYPQIKEEYHKIISVIKSQIQ